MNYYSVYTRILLPPIYFLIMVPEQQNNTMWDNQIFHWHKVEELSKKISTPQNKIDPDHNTLQIALDKTEQKAQKSIDQNTKNQEELKHLKSWFNEQRKIQKTTEFNNRLEQVIEDLKI